MRRSPPNMTLPRWPAARRNRRGTCLPRSTWAKSPSACISALRGPSSSRWAWAFCAASSSITWCPQGTVRDDVFVNGIFYVVGQGFIRLMQMLVVPLVFCSIVCGASSIGDTKTLGTIGLKTLAFYLCTTALAVTVALSIGNLDQPRPRRGHVQHGGIRHLRLVGQRQHRRVVHRHSAQHHPEESHSGASLGRYAGHHLLRAVRGYHPVHHGPQGRSGSPLLRAVQRHHDEDDLHGHVRGPHRRVLPAGVARSPTSASTRSFPW